MKNSDIHALDFEAISEDGKAIAEIRVSIDALRDVRTSLIALAFALGQHPGTRGYLVLVRPAITVRRLREEWLLAKSALKPEIFKRLTVCVLTPEGTFRSIPENPPSDVQTWLLKAAAAHRTSHSIRTARIDYDFVVLKLLIYQWLTARRPVTTTWLANTAGCTYPTVARILKQLGSLIERGSDRRVSLRYLPRNELSRLFANAAKARATTRFVDVSGQPRTPEEYLHRLDTMKPDHMAIGGVIGARHFVPDLDIVGTPRLDLSLHSPDGQLGLAFIKALDPALKQQSDPLKPANVVIHIVRHLDPLFSKRENGLAWADPVECLLDLHEAHLESQAHQFLETLEHTHRTEDGN